MATKTGSKKKVGKDKDKAPRERAVTEASALLVIERLKSGESTVMAEARQLGCYHATLRKALRAAIGAKEYGKLMSAKKATKAKKVTKAAKPKKVAKRAAKKATKRVVKRATKVESQDASIPSADTPKVETGEPQS